MPSFLPSGHRSGPRHLPTPPSPPNRYREALGMFTAQQLTEKGSCSAACNVAITLYALATADADSVQKGESWLGGRRIEAGTKLAGQERDEPGLKGSEG